QLLAVGAHLRRDVGEQRRLHERAGVIGATAAGQHGGALVDRVLDLRVQVLRGPLGGERGEGGRRVGRVAGGEGRERLGEAFDERLRTLPPAPPAPGGASTSA